MKKSNPYKLYILMRCDLDSLNPGKAMAQACHAANQFVDEWWFAKGIKKWQAEGIGFGTTIVLEIFQAKLARIITAARKKNIPCGLVLDTTYPMITNREVASLICPKKVFTAPPIFKDDGRVVIFREEVTCGYIFVEDGSSAQREFVSDLPLHP